MNEVKNTNSEICDEKGETHHSTLTMVSFSFANFIDEILNVAFGVVVFFFYEVVIGLNVLLIFFAYAIYSIWNAINDPLMGYLTDRPFTFTKKLGRRFPWILIGAVGWLFMYILIFTPPTLDPINGAIILFIWLAATTSIYDTFSSIKSTNFQSLFPDKFRGEERKKASGIMGFIGFFGIALGSILPSLFTEGGTPQDYLTQAIVLVIVGLVGALLMIPGTRDDQYAVDRYLEQCEEETERESFIEMFKTTLKQRNYRWIVIIYFMLQTVTALLLSSIYYLTAFILQDEGATLIIMVSFLLGALISAPVWTLLAKKMQNNRKMMIINGVVEVLFLTPLLIGQTLMVILIGAGLFGFAFGGHAVIFRGLVFPDVIDESVAEMGKRREGTFVGVRDFFGRLSFLAQAGIFAFIHIITGFNSAATVQTPLAIFGIQAHLALVPMILTAIITIMIWKLYDITPEKSEEINKKIMSLKL